MSVDQSDTAELAEYMTGTEMLEVLRQALESKTMLPLDFIQKATALCNAAASVQDLRMRYLAANPDKDESFFPKPINQCNLVELLNELNTTLSGEG